MGPEKATATLPCYNVFWKFILVTYVVTLVTLHLLRPHNDRNVVLFDTIQKQANNGKRHLKTKGAISRWLPYERKEENKKKERSEEGRRERRKRGGEYILKKKKK